MSRSSRRRLATSLRPGSTDRVPRNSCTETAGRKRKSAVATTARSSPSLTVFSCPVQPRPSVMLGGNTAEHQLFNVAIEAAADNARQLRVRCQQWLQAMGVRSAVVDDLTLAVYEASANAVEHACDPDRPTPTPSSPTYPTGSALRPGRLGLRLEKPLRPGVPADPDHGFRVRSKPRPPADPRRAGQSLPTGHEAARNLDVLRSALGAKVTYLGYSYGARKIDINRIAPGRANLTAVAGRGFDLGSHQPTDRCSHCEDQQLCPSKCGPDTDGARRPHPRPSAEDVPSSVQLRWRPADHQADHR
jgi:Histidine kinase-like ATPase domain